MPNSTGVLEVNLQDFSPTTASGAAKNPIAQSTWNTWFQAWLDRCDRPIAVAYELSLRLTDDAEIQSLNADYRGKDTPTDVLAFAALESEVPQPTAAILAGEPLYLGDIVISVETAQRQAQQQGHSLAVELAWLAAHGFLHLLGWDHPDDASLEKMLVQQETLLKNVGQIN